jgi:hemoglobin-like flavoprotein
MTPEQIQIVRLTIAQALADRLAVEQEFYRRLFVIAPDLGARFRGQVEQESWKLHDTLALGFGALTDVPLLVATLEGLARHGTARSLSDHHFKAIAQALLGAVEWRIGAAFTPQVRSAWIALFTVAVTVLRRPAAVVHRARAA